MLADDTLFHAWSPDGETLYYQRLQEADGHIWRFGPDGDARFALPTEGLGEHQLRGVTSDSGVLLFEVDETESGCTHTIAIAPNGDLAWVAPGQSSSASPRGDRVAIGNWHPVIEPCAADPLLDAGPVVAHPDWPPSSVVVLDASGTVITRFDYPAGSRPGAESMPGSGSAGSSDLNGMRVGVNCCCREWRRTATKSFGSATSSRANSPNFIAFLHLPHPARPGSASPSVRSSARYPSAMPDVEVSEEARALLQRAMALHTAGEIDAALATAEEAVAAEPGFGGALSYLGNTLVTRKRRFADGLAALDRAVSAAPEDPAIVYTAGWCHEFVANALERPKGAHQPVAESAADLYASARALMLRALELDPDTGLRADIEDILDVLAAATGEPWSDEEVTRAAPRAR